MITSHIIPQKPPFGGRKEVNIMQLKLILPCCLKAEIGRTGKDLYLTCQIKEECLCVGGGDLSLEEHLKRGLNYLCSACPRYSSVSGL